MEGEGKNAQPVAKKIAETEKEEKVKAPGPSLGKRAEGPSG